MAQQIKRKFKMHVPKQEVQKYCYFCAVNMHSIDYKNSEFLRRFMNSEGKIYPRKKTGTCARDQRELTEALKRARFLALVPYTLRVKRRP